MVNLEEYWHSSAAFSDDDVVFQDDDPNARFYCYLIDRDALEPLWMARSEVNGIEGGDSALVFKLVRKVSKDLREKGFLAVR
ncbi:hypothetical protein [Marinilabilia salmonicolor]|uniref:hypothetical protein n=1 Tax=Marinilabilia salmonicolor TaxID=989 RepID=UPI000302650C|nr:hypothetical protein [Marinilabilia salmonicolor]